MPSFFIGIKINKEHAQRCTTANRGAQRHTVAYVDLFLPEYNTDNSWYDGSVGGIGPRDQGQRM